MRFVPTLTLAVLLCCACVCAIARAENACHDVPSGRVAIAQLPPDMAERLEAELGAATVHEGLPSQVAGVVYKGRALFTGGWGLRNLSAPDDGPPTADTPYRIASVTKAFTAMQYMRAVEQRVVLPLDPVSAHLRGFSIANPMRYPGEIVLDHLASHRAGLATNSPCNVSFRNLSMCYAPQKELLARIAAMELRSPPGAIPSYSNLGYAVLGNALAAAYNTSWDELLQRLVVDPLGLRDTGTGMATFRARKDRAIGYLEPVDWSAQSDGVGAGVSVSTTPAELDGTARTGLQKPAALKESTSTSSASSSTASFFSPLRRARNAPSSVPPAAPLLDYGWQSPSSNAYASLNDLLRFVVHAATPVSYPQWTAAQHAYDDSQGVLGRPWEGVVRNGYNVLTKSGDTEGYHAMIMFVPELEIGAALIRGVQSGGVDAPSHSALLRFITRDFPEKVMQDLPLESYTSPPRPIEDYVGIYSATSPFFGTRSIHISLYDDDQSPAGPQRLAWTMGGMPQPLNHRHDDTFGTAATPGLPCAAQEASRNLLLHFLDNASALTMPDLQWGLVFNKTNART